MAIGGSAGGNYSPQMYGGSYRGSPYSVQNILNQDRFGQRHGYGMSPYGMSMQPPMMPDWGGTQWMNPYSGPYSRPYFPQTTGSFFRNNAPAFGFYGQPETFGMPGPGYRAPFGVNPYSSFNPYNYGQPQPMGGPSKGAPQQGYDPNGMYDVVYNPETGSFETAGFTPSDRPAMQPTPAGGPSKGAPQQGYNPNAMYDNEGGFTPIEEWLKNNPSAYNNIVNTIGGRR